MNGDDFKYINDDHQLADGFGNCWVKCDLKSKCELEIVRPGKVQCNRCDEEDLTTNKQHDTTNNTSGQQQGGSKEFKD